MNSGDGMLAGHPFVVAHRGASAECPEHTLAAYEWIITTPEIADLNGVDCCEIRRLFADYWLLQVVWAC